MVLAYGSNAMMGVKLMFQVISRAESGHQGSGIASPGLTGDFGVWAALPVGLLLLNLLPGRQSSA